jgi:hypothetical protein
LSVEEANAKIEYLENEIIKIPENHENEKMALINEHEQEKKQIYDNH